MQYVQRIKGGNGMRKFTGGAGVCVSIVAFTLNPRKQRLYLRCSIPTPLNTAHLGHIWAVKEPNQPEIPINTQRFAT